jgi:hypothetical protein
MKTLSVTLIILLVGFFAGSASAEKKSDTALHDMHMIMRFMNHGLSIALEGADMQMLGQLGLSEKLDRDAIVHGTIMVNDGKGMIKEMLEGKAMQAVYKEGTFDQKIMDDLHILGDKMLEVIEQVKKLHGHVNKQVTDKK